MSNKTGRLKRRLEGLSTPPIKSQKSPRNPKLAFGDRVRVKATEEANAAGAAGLTGEIIGFTKRSGSSVVAIGAAGDDFAFNVFFKETESTAWLAEDQLELLEHSPGADGSKGHVDSATTDGKKSAWKFW
jgi:hypothetical protein